jgi:hypothetical protein
MMIVFPRPADALPSFARQTGQPCGTCHTDQPGLTPFGRRFKLGGYTLGGGEFRTTPFPTSEEDKNKPWVPPVAMMAIIGYTHTQAPLPPPTDPFKPNDNVVVSPFSVFYGGAITEHIGAFAQVTHNAPPPGGFPDPFGHTWSWDNVDLRYANTAKLGGLDVIYGITANNNPTVQDVWNTTPAWTFPYATSTIAPTPATKVLIDAAFAAHVGGVGGYVFINDMLYLEATGYSTLNFREQNSLGTDPFSAPGLFDGASPYWRAAFESHWGNHWLEIGTFGMFAAVHPWADTVFFTPATFSQTDKYTDIGFDSQYQYQGENYWFTLRGSYIHEHQRLDATFFNGGSANLTNEPNSLRLQASLAYGNDNRFVLTGNISTPGARRTRSATAGLRAGSARTATAGLARLPTFRLSRAARRFGHGSTRAWACSTSGTTSSMAIPSTPATRTPCSSMLGWRCRTVDCWTSRQSLTRS